MTLGIWRQFLISSPGTTGTDFLKSFCLPETSIPPMVKQLKIILNSILE